MEIVIGLVLFVIIINIISNIGSKNKKTLTPAQRNTLASGAYWMRQQRHRQQQQQQYQQRHRR